MILAFLLSEERNLACEWENICFTPQMGMLTHTHTHLTSWYMHQGHSLYSTRKSIDMYLTCFYASRISVYAKSDYRINTLTQSNRIIGIHILHRISTENNFTKKRVSFLWRERQRGSNNGRFQKLLSYAIFSRGEALFVLSAAAPPTTERRSKCLNVSGPWEAGSSVPGSADILQPSAGSDQRPPRSNQSLGGKARPLVLALDQLSLRTNH